MLRLPMGRGFGYLIYLCLVILLGALVAYAAQRTRQQKRHREGLPADKPSFWKELLDRLKNPYKPTDD